MHLNPGQTLIWQKISPTECRVIFPAKAKVKPDPIAALGFAKEHGLETEADRPADLGHGIPDVDRRHDGGRQDPRRLGDDLRSSPVVVRASRCPVQLAIGETVPEMLAADLAAEVRGRVTMIEMIALAEKKQDYATRDLITRILDDTEEHIDFLETQIAALDQIGLQNYLQSQYTLESGN